MDKHNLKLTIESQDKKINELQHVINILQQENAQLRAQNQKLLHERYGRKSEKVPEEILPVIDEAVVTPEEAKAIQQVEEEISVSSYTRKKPKRNPIPKEYPREEIIYDLSEEQKSCNCGAELHCIGEKIYEQLDYVPAKIKVLAHIRKKYGCRNCEFWVTVATAPKEYARNNFRISTLTFTSPLEQRYS